MRKRGGDHALTAVPQDMWETSPRHTQPLLPTSVSRCTGGAPELVALPRCSKHDMGINLAIHWLQRVSSSGMQESSIEHAVIALVYWNQDSSACKCAVMIGGKTSQTSNAESS